MFSKCANPKCSAPFHYKEGKFFRFHRSHTDGEPPPNIHSVQHFWLCDACSANHALEYQGERGVIIRLRSTPSPELKAIRFVTPT